jgi:hypothetical protein
MRFFIFLQRLDIRSSLFAALSAYALNRHRPSLPALCRQPLAVALPVRSAPAQEAAPTKKQ